MKSQLILFAILASTIFLFQCQDQASGTSAEGNTVESDTLTLAQSIERGQHLVTVMDCNICHSPKKMTDKGPVPDKERMLSGFPADSQLPEIDKSLVAPGKWVLFNQDLTATVGPWGVTFAANLTSDESGIGNWSYEQFNRALTKGKHKGLEDGRMIQPPMPWQAFSHLSDEDIKAIYDYLQSIPPVRNVVPSYIPPPQM